MSTPLLSILTPSYNKPDYIMDAVNAVLNQSFNDFEYWLIDNSTDNGKTRRLLRPLEKQDPRIKYLEIDFSTKERQQSYVPAYIFNQVFKETTSPYGFFLSDDDTLQSTCFGEMVRHLEGNQHMMVAYHTQNIFIWDTHRWMGHGQREARLELGMGTQYTNVDCMLDGGQIMWRNEVLKGLSYPYVTENPTHASHCDGLFLNKLAEKYTFYPVAGGKVLSTHRVTPLSTWQRAPKT